MAFSCLDLTKPFKKLNIIKIVEYMSEQSGIDTVSVRNILRGIHNSKRAAIRGGTKGNKTPQSLFFFLFLVFVFVCSLYLCLFVFFFLK